MNRSLAGKEKILVVEDEPGIRQVCQRTLVSQGYRVDTASNGAAAENMLTQEEYDLVVVDIRTPVMNGKQLHQYIKEKCPELINGVIFTTGDIIGSDTQCFLEQSGRPYLAKPFTPDELVAIVRETLSRLQ